MLYTSVTFSANTALNTAVYTATITNNLPVVVALTCDPSPCPFNVDNSGKVTVAADLQSNGVSLYTWSLEADDTYNTVVSQNISVIITDINVAPTITNLNDVATVLENQPIGTSVYHVSYSDVNGDTPTFSASFTPAACASMYNIGTSDGIVSTRVALDFESDPSCSMVVDVFDGRATSSPGTLTINVADVDETPVWLQAGYTYSTPEVPSGTALAVAGISATDPEGAAISYSIGCGSDSGYLTVDPTSGAVTMTAAFDLEVSAVNTHTLACTLTAADATGQSSGADLSGAAVGATFSLTMTATDGGTPPLSDTAVVMVIVVSTTTTTTTTTAATTAAAASTGSEESTGFLSSTESIVFFVLACVISAMLAAVLGFLVWKFCCRNAYTNGATKVAPNQGTNQSNKYEVLLVNIGLYSVLLG
ncbi:cadherin-3-like [Dreissena polymorpha]|nr:cadherin-3-like [Dreissena polymorpha]